MNLILNPKRLIKELSILEYVLLEVIYTQNKAFFTKMNTLYPDEVENTLNVLQNQSYIKVMGEDLDQLIVRSKTSKLFGVNQVEIDIDEVLNHLNTKIKLIDKNKRGYKKDSTANRKFVRARLQEGYSCNELKQVVDVKAKQCTNGSFSLFYLRPQTLFNNEKFQSYINEVDGDRNNKTSGRFSLPGED